MIDVALVVVPSHLRKHIVCSHTEIAISQITKIGQCLPLHSIHAVWCGSSAIAIAGNPKSKAQPSCLWSPRKMKK